jgi:hypothetical protein
VHRLVDVLEAARHAGELGQDGGPPREQVRDVEAARQADDGLGRRPRSSASSRTPPGTRRCW